ncbi:hypothetical protein B0F90DRAFT_1710946 [Multifurca ochricompacta]|uniref:Chromatin modification-related protein n=1 Tax=Multifurca ochricompacta TaxID=376703 RepID=A0AAD4M5T4_9AGAM|nr:hypothetical protein B0F90DRAFT_1710946 [Multifurca ochricompacta]
MPRSNKRKRASLVQAEILDEDNEIEEVSVSEGDGEPDLNTEEPGYQEGNTDLEANHKFEVEAELWDSFREEFHEAVEQLPLYLHRSYALLRELDEQVTGRYNELLPTLQRYIRLRRIFSGQRDSNNVKESSPQTELGVKQAGDTPQNAKQALETPKALPVGTTRELLRHLGWLMEEVVRGSQEKVGLAQAAYDSVDRHIRLLDQSIREQDMSISFGLRQGTHPSLLPDLAAPSRWARATRVTHSPIPGLSDDEDIMVPEISASSEVTIGMAMGGEAPRGTSSWKKGKKSKKRKLDKTVSEAEGAPMAAASSTRSLRLKVPPLTSALQADAITDPDEPKYCYCNRVSFGNMVACDYPQCKREWFHLDCVGLTEEPQSRTWYCRDCEPLVRKAELAGSKRRGR